jgi:hypothetical protein
MTDAKRAGTIALLITGIVFLCAGGGIGGLGALYILSAHDQGTGDPGRQLALGIGMVVVGLFIWLLAALGAFLAWRRLQPKPEQKVTIHQEVELTGDVDLASLNCEKCNAKLDKDAIKVQAGAIVVSCPYCGSTYQMVEEPKW